MIGSIIGDFVGSSFETFSSSKNKKRTKIPVGFLFSDKSKFTDDTVLTVATADAILNDIDYSECFYRYAKKYPDVGYGSMFKEAVSTGQLKPYNSYGNGAAMRVGPVGWVYNTLGETLDEAEKNAQCTHNHPEGIRGAKAVALAIFVARFTKNKDDIKKAMSQTLFYDLSRNTSDFKKGNFDVTCQGTIPLCMAIFTETMNFEEAMKKSIEMGGDVDTNACIVGSICDAYYGMPSNDMIYNVYERLPKDITDIVTKFTQKYIDKNFEPPQIGVLENSILNLEV